MTGIFSEGLAQAIVHGRDSAPVRLIIAYPGEDPDKVVEAFYRENPLIRVSYTPVVMYAHSGEPRPELCSPKPRTRK